eukprot:219949-Amphidinium_carterae.3
MDKARPIFGSSGQESRCVDLGFVRGIQKVKREAKPNGAVSVLWPFVVFQFSSSWRVQLKLVFWQDDCRYYISASLQHDIF